MTTHSTDFKIALGFDLSKGISTSDSANFIVQYINLKLAAMGHAIFGNGTPGMILDLEKVLLNTNKLPGPLT